MVKNDVYLKEKYDVEFWLIAGNVRCIFYG